MLYYALNLPKLDLPVSIFQYLIFLFRAPAVQEVKVVELYDNETDLLIVFGVCHATLPAEATSGQQLQSLEGQITHLSDAVSQLLHQRWEDYTGHDTQTQLEALQAKCFR